MSNPDLSSNFFIRLNEGRESAIADLDRRYRQQLCALVEREMGRRFAAREDPEDAVQSAMASFCRGVKDKQFQVDQAGKLWGLLAKITRHKMLHHIEHEDTGGRTPGREAGAAGDWIPNREPSPEDAAHAADVIEQVIEGLQPPDPEIFRLRLEGYTREEIAERFKLTVATVRSKLDRVKARIRKLLALIEPSTEQ